MKVFISWSGEKSRQVAQLLNDTMPVIIQSITPFISTQDISAGTVWYKIITDALSASSVGIFCLTAENKENPWIMFEAGALSKGDSNALVGTFLIDLKASDVKQPLASFNHTTTEKVSFKKLFNDLNSKSQTPLKPEILDRSFETHWPEFEKQMNLILQTDFGGKKEVKRSQEDMMDELVVLTRQIADRVQYTELYAEFALKLAEENRSIPKSPQSGLSDIMGRKITKNNFVKFDDGFMTGIFTDESGTKPKV